MSTKQTSLQNQESAINEMKQRTEPVVSIIGGNEITALPNVYGGWLDSELMCEVIQIPKGAEVLDLCTGTGVIAIKAAQLGASHVVAVDLNPEAVKSAQFNVDNLNLPQVEIREGSMFEPVKGMTFDVIIINPPYMDHEAADKTEICFWDEGNNVTRQFFGEYAGYLKPGGKVYLAWGDFADMEILKTLADEHNVHLVLLDSKTTPSGQETFLAYELHEKA
jgi:release factor glutamine methyltransferase